MLDAEAVEIALVVVQLKKSDVILTIAECLVEPHSDNVTREAEYILKRLENMGLIPSPYMKPVTEKALEGPGSLTYYVRTEGWEPEVPGKE